MDYTNVPYTLLWVLLLLVMATLYIMRRRVRLGRRKPKF
jgi:hypothetical protein